MSEQALRAIAWGGRHLVIGFATGDIPRIATNLLLLKGASLVGVNFGGYAMQFGESAGTICEEVMSLMAKGDSLWPLISHREPMSEGGGAIAGLLDRSGVGKILLHTPG